MLKFIMLCLIVSALAPTEGQCLEVTATLPIGIAMEDAQLSLTLDGGHSQVTCPLGGFSGSGPIFFCKVTPGMHSARFLFIIPGYKPYSINLANLAVKDEFTEVKLGALKPLDSDEPRIENIVLTRGNNGAIRFQITINNLSKKQVLIKGLNMQASEDIECGVGIHPPMFFKISDKLLLTPSMSGKAGIQGTIADPADHPEFQAQVSGNGVFHPCGHNEFTLSAQMNFTIPALDYYEIELLIPASKRSKAGHDSFIPGSRSSPTSISTIDAVDRFNKIRFSFGTSDKDHPAINFTYDSSR